MTDSQESRDRFLAGLRTAQDRWDMERLLSHEMLERTPAIFQEDRAAWIEWKSRLAAGLEVDPLSILLVGGAALGFSPINDLHFFGPKSDIDVAVISPRHFDLAWHKLRSYKVLPPGKKQAIEEHRKRYIYWGAIATDLELSCFDFGASWATELSKMARQPVTFGREVNARIYRDPASLRSYQLVGLIETQRALRRRRRR